VLVGWLVVAYLFLLRGKINYLQLGHVGIAYSKYPQVFSEEEVSTERGDTTSHNIVPSAEVVTVSSNDVHVYERLENNEVKDNFTVDMERVYVNEVVYAGDQT
jgi:hypothetical protein